MIWPVVGLSWPRMPQSAWSPDRSSAIQGRRRVPARDIEVVSRWAPEQSLFILRKPLHWVVDQGFSGHTAGRITPEIITFILRDAESCD
jgi:hypothetical protein